MTPSYTKSWLTTLFAQSWGRTIPKSKGGYESGVGIYWLSLRISAMSLKTSDRTP